MINLKITAKLTAISLALLTSIYASADIVHLDDVIIDGSACIGMDCVNGESFGFDTIRIKENNLRIKAQDTSSSASFPTNDWQITFNDSANGGANKFSIDDIDGGRTPFTIEAGAPANSLYVEDSGRLGLGTSNPVVDIHVTSGNTPTLRLEQDGSSGFTPQTWDVAGNEANFFVRDATNGSTLPFKIFPGSPSNSLNIQASTGYIGLGTTNPQDDLHIVDAGPARIRLENSSAATSTTDNPVWNLNSNGTFRISAGTSGGTIPFTLSADGDLSIAGELTTATTTYPDYVFEKDYQLMPLDNVKSYIEANGHLPNVPSAKEMIENGINLTQMHIKLMEKVEELTLYNLKQHEDINMLKRQLALLTNK